MLNVINQFRRIYSDDGRNDKSFDSIASQLFSLGAWRGNSPKPCALLGPSRAVWLSK
jgi:hypothetical protein